MVLNQAPNPSRRLQLRRSNLTDPDPPWPATASHGHCQASPGRHAGPGPRPATFPIKNVKLRVKPKAVLSHKDFWLYIACTGYAENSGCFRLLQFRTCHGSQ